MVKLLNSSRRHEHYVVISDDVLVADLRQAKTSGVVRLKLTDLSFAHFYVRSDEQGSKLGFTTGSNDFVVLGIFADRTDADNLLKEIRREMLKIETLHRFFGLRTFFMGASVIITLIFLVWFYGKVTQQNLPQMNDPLPIDESYREPVPPSQSPAEIGKPMDADSKLNVPE